MSASDSLAGLARRSRPQAALRRAAHELSLRQVPLFLALSVVSAATLLVGRLDQGWYPHDDGSLAHSAQRVLAGELPHRDFVDLYTGLLSLLNAAVFAVLGEDIFNLRIPLFVLFLAFAGCFFAIARRLVSPVLAFIATLFAISWSVPVYPAPMPSWYLLFFAMFGTYAVMRFFETDRRRWLLLAGTFGGISLAVKIVGIWYVVPVVLVLLIRPLLDAPEPGSYRPNSRTYTAIVASSALFAYLLVAAVVSSRPGSGEVVGMLIPVAVICGAVALVGLRAWTGSYYRGSGTAVISDVAVFFAGVGVPITLFLVPFAVSGSVGDLVEGVLIAPRSRFEFASWYMPPAATLLRAAPVIALFIARTKVTGKRRQVIDVVAGVAIVFLAVTAADQSSYVVLWGTTRAIAPFVIVLGALAIVRRSNLPAEIDSRLVALIVLVGGFSMLVQFPFARPVYFCYSVPLLLLAALGGMRRLGSTSGLLPGVVLIALAVFGIRQLDHQSVLTIGVAYSPDPQVTLLDQERASIHVRPEEREVYDTVRGLVAQRAVNGRPIFAGPDAPEIYFLTQSRNPTPSIMDFLDRSGTTRGDRLIRLLKDKDVAVVVLNLEPSQSPTLEQSTIRRIRLLYGGSQRVGHFDVRWIAGH